MAEPAARASVRAGLAALTTVLAVALAGCGGDEPTGELAGRVVDPPFEVSAEPLEDLDGEAFSLAEDTDERLTLVFFGYTNCPDICPTVLKTLASALTRLDERDRDQLEVLFVTTDPARDTPEVIRRYLDSFDPSFKGVTGPVEDIADVAKSVAVGMGTVLPTGGYEVDAHSTQITAIDSADEAPVYWPSTTSSQQFADDIHTLLGE